MSIGLGTLAFPNLFHILLMVMHYLSMAWFNCSIAEAKKMMIGELFTER